MELETTKLINISNKKNDIKSPSSLQKQLKKITNILQLVITLLCLFFTLIIIVLVFILKAKNLVIRFLENKNKIKDFNYYIQKQNYFCDYIHLVYDKQIEEEIDLFNISLGNTTFEMFIYNNDDYISNQIRKQQYLNDKETLNILNALKSFASDNDILNPKEVIMIDIGGNIGWYPTYLGTFKYTIVTFEPYSKNYYLLKKNYCRNNRDFFGDKSSIIIINKGLYTDERKCDYYKDVNNKKKDLIFCDKSKINNLDNDYKKIETVEMARLNDYLQYFDNRNVALVRIDLDAEGAKAIETGKILFSQFHVPYVFVEFNKKSFLERETHIDYFFKEFFDDGYKISFDGFFDNQRRTVEEIMNIEQDRISLYLTFLRK